VLDRPVERDDARFAILYLMEQAINLNNRSLALDILHNGRVECSLVCKTHFLGKGGSRNPLGGGSGCGLLHHSVHLLEGKTLGFVDEEIGIEEAQDAERSPDEEYAGAEVALVGSNHVGCDNSDDAVPEPVRSSSKADTTRTDREGEDFANDNPSTRAPGSSKEENVNADERNHSAHGFMIRSIGDTNDGNYELAHEHAASSPDEQWTTSNSLDGPERNGRGADIDESRDKTDKERVGDGPELLEESSAKVENEVDASPLLHHL